LFRAYLKEHGFNVPKAQGFSTYEEALEVIDTFKLPVMVKPVDSAGSKGVNKMTDKAKLKEYVEDALHYSLSKRFVIEEFIVKKSPQISGDAFSVDGKIVFHCLGNEFYNPNIERDFAPLGECWPFSMDQSIIDNLMKDIQRLITSLGMKSTAYNVEAIVGEDDKIYLIELGARAGGSLIPQLVNYVTGVNYVPYVIKAAVGDDCSELKMAEAKGCWSNYMVHPNVTGKFVSIEFDNLLQEHMAEWAPDVKVGDPIHKFRGAQDCIGELILRYDNPKQMMEIIKNIEDYIHIKVS
jgi:biotin carboxylase